MELYITTLGEFDIKSEEKSIMKQYSRTYRLYKLFEYFLTFRNQKLLPETIIDNLLSGSNSDDPKNMLRTQIFRLRKIIKAFVPEDMDESDYMTIKFVNGYYCLEIGKKVVIDVDEFESTIKHGDLELKKNIQISMDSYQKALKLYNGLYLPDNPYEVWLVPTRSYYHRLYLKTLYKLIDILKESNENEKIITLCEEALLIEPYEENIHMKLIDAMLALGQQKGAMRHYENALKLMEKEFDARPSSDFTDMLDKIQNYSERDANANIVSIEIGLEEKNLSGAMQCSAESFKFLFNLQKRKLLKDDEREYICIINVKWNGDRNIEGLAKLLKDNLRNSDVFTFWNQNQALVMLNNMNDDGTGIIESRIYDNLKKYTQLNRSDISMNFQPIVSNKFSI